jgi:hypothetical protein
MTVKKMSWKVKTMEVAGGNDGRGPVRLDGEMGRAAMFCGPLRSAVLSGEGECR